MPTTIRRHRVIQRALVNGTSDHLSLSLTDGKAGLRAASRYADTYHSYEFTARNGEQLHVAYARFEGGSAKHGFSSFTDADVTYLYEVTDKALTASYGYAEPIRIHATTSGN